MQLLSGWYVYLTDFQCELFMIYILTVFTTVYIVLNSYTLFGYISVYSYQYIISANELYIIHNYYRLCD